MPDSELFTQFKAKALEVNFKDSATLLQSLGMKNPDSTFVMNNSYALLISSEVPNSLEEYDLINHIVEIKQLLTEWIRTILLHLENTKGLLVDGYLVILLRNPPSSEIKEIIRELESDPKVCRKHIVWPDLDSSNTSLKLVTILGLPESPPAIGQIQSDFEISPEVRFILDKYQEVKSLDKLVEIIKSPENAD